jgi:uncharacterized membrane protein
MNNTTVRTLIIVVALLPVTYLLTSWSSLPEPVVLKFDVNERMQRIQSRTDLLLASSVISFSAIVMSLLLPMLRKVDPKVTADSPSSNLNKLGIIICIFLTALNVYLVLSARYGWVVDSNVIVGFTGLLVCLLGNVMNNIKPNYFAGIRLPWTLNDPDNWRRTHQLAGKLWFAAGILIILFSCLVKGQFLIAVLITILLLAVVIPTVYSFNIYRQNKIKHHS